MKGEVLKAVRVRLYPNAEQQHIIASQIGAVRYVYNRTLLKDREKTSWRAK